MACRSGSSGSSRAPQSFSAWLAFFSALSPPFPSRSIAFLPDSFWCERMIYLFYLFPGVVWEITNSNISNGVKIRRCTRTSIGGSDLLQLHRVHTTSHAFLGEPTSLAKSGSLHGVTSVPYKYLFQSLVISFYFTASRLKSANSGHCLVSNRCIHSRLVLHSRSRRSLLHAHHWQKVSILNIRTSISTIW